MNWEESENRADTDINLGRFKTFNSIEELIADLHDYEPTYYTPCPFCEFIYFPDFSIGVCPYCFGNN